MRILTVGNMYPPHHLGGYELMWRSAVTWLRDRGHEVRVLTTDYRAPEPDPSTPQDEDVHRDLRWYWHDHSFPRLGPRAVARLERHNARVLDHHLADLGPEAVSWWAMGGMSLSLIERTRRAGVAASCVVVDDWPLYGPRVDRRARFTRLPTRRKLARAGSWLFASNTLAERARKGGWELAEARVAFPGIDHALFYDPPPPRGEWAWRLLYCGRIDERKGIDLAVESLAHMPPGARLRVVGGGDEEHLSALGALTDRLGLAGRVSFERRPRAELPSVYAEADATLFPVRWAEPFGLVPLESMAMGTPAVASGRGGSGEYLRDGENCVLFDADLGGQGLADAVLRLAESPDERGRIRRGGLETSARFGEESFNQAVETSLLEAASSTRPRASGRGH